MAEWFEAKVSFLRQMDNGLIKKVTEQYLVDSHSFAECEARVLKEQGDGVREIQVATMKRSPIKEVVMYGDTDLWFKVKVTYSAIDEATEKEKKITTYLLVNASNVIEATQRTEEHLKEMLVPYQIPKVEESKIVDVFEHVSGTKRVAPTLEKSAPNPADGQPHEFDMEEECAMEADAVESEIDHLRSFRDNFPNGTPDRRPSHDSERAYPNHLKFLTSIECVKQPREETCSTLNSHTKSVDMPLGTSTASRKAKPIPMPNTSVGKTAKAQNDVDGRKIFRIR